MAELTVQLLNSRLFSDAFLGQRLNHSRAQYSKLFTRKEGFNSLEVLGAHCDLKGTLNAKPRMLSSYGIPVNPLGGKKTSLMWDTKDSFELLCSLH